MEVTPKTVSDLKLLLFNLTNTVRLCECIIIDNNLQFNAKYSMNKVKDLAQKAINELELNVTPEHRAIIRKEITDNYESGSILNVLHNAANMTDNQRNVYDEVGSAIIAGTFRVHTEEELAELESDRRHKMDEDRDRRLEFDEIEKSDYESLKENEE